MNSKSWRFGDEELAYIKEVLDSGFGSSTTGNMNQRLEAAFAERFGVRYAITHANEVARPDLLSVYCDVRRRARGGRLRA